MTLIAQEHDQWKPRITFQQSRPPLNIVIILIVVLTRMRHLELFVPERLSLQITPPSS